MVIRFKHFSPCGVMYRKSFVCLCRQTISHKYTIFNRFTLCQIWITYINFKTYEVYLRELKHDQTGNRMHKHFSFLLESVKKKAFFSIWNETNTNYLKKILYRLTSNSLVSLKCKTFFSLLLRQNNRQSQNIK